MRNVRLFILVFTLATLTACSSDDDTSYPNLITDFVMAFSDSQGKLQTIQTDDGQKFAVENSVTGMPANSSVRALCDYLHSTEGHVTIYSITGIPILSRLKDNFKLRRAPTGVASVWYSGGYINMHLLPKTHGGLQNWAFSVDSTTANATGGANYFLSLYHDQLIDSEAYTGHLYISLSPDSIAADIQPADSFHLSITSYTGINTWHFKAR